jgi:pimeloyl-ACP methyl ester carboxylesterase
MAWEMHLCNKIFTPLYLPHYYLSYLPAQAISKNMDLPQFAIWGDSDSVLPLKDVKDKISEIMPKLQLFVIKDSGHLPHKK